MSDTVATKIPLDHTKMEYARSWQKTQEEQDAYDDHMRRKVNYQKSDYVQDGEKICFGVSEHTFEEATHKWSEQARKDIAVLNSWFNPHNLEDIATRPCNRSDFNFTNYHTRAQIRVGLGLLLIREMPIRNFYVRCWISYFYCMFFVVRGIGRGMQITRPIGFYNHEFHFKSFLNYPNLGLWNLGRRAPKPTPIPDVHREW